MSDDSPEVTALHDLKPTATELIRFGSTGFEISPAMLVEIHFGPKLRRKIGNIVPVFSVPSGFKLSDFISYLNPDCALKESDIPNDFSYPGKLIEVHKGDFILYRVVATPA